MDSWLRDEAMKAGEASTPAAAAASAAAVVALTALTQMDAGTCRAELKPFSLHFCMSFVSIVFKTALVHSALYQAISVDREG